MGYGFYNCKGMTQNQIGTAKTSAYSNCYVSISGAGPVPADNAIGGYNKGYGAPADAIPVSRGGTGGTTTEGARANLEVAYYSAVPVPVSSVFTPNADYVSIMKERSSLSDCGPLLVGSLALYTMAAIPGSATTSLGIITVPRVYDTQSQYYGLIIEDNVAYRKQIGTGWLDNTTGTLHAWPDNDIAAGAILNLMLSIPKAS
jgi:hypothetical protein